MTAFVDSNLLVYARDASEPEQQPIARRWMDRLWETEQGRLSVVLNEFYLPVTRKLQPGMSLGDAQADVKDLLSWNPAPITAELQLSAWTVESRSGLHYWDALIVAGAQSIGCGFLLTEDLQDRQELDGVMVVNPFACHPEEILPG